MMAREPDEEIAMDRDSIDPLEFAVRFRSLLVVSPAVATDGKEPVRGYMMTVGNPTLGAVTANFMGMHNDQIVPADSTRVTAGRWSRIVRGDVRDVRHEGGLDLVLLAPPRGTAIGPWVECGMKWLRDGGLLAAVMPLSEFQAQLPSAFVPSVPRGGIGETWIREMQGYRLPGLKFRYEDGYGEGAIVVVAQKAVTTQADFGHLESAALLEAARQVGDGAVPDVQTLVDSAIAVMDEIPQEFRGGATAHGYRGRKYEDIRWDSRTRALVEGYRDEVAEMAESAGDDAPARPALLRAASRMVDMDRRAGLRGTVTAVLGLHSVRRAQQDPTLMPYMLRRGLGATVVGGEPTFTPDGSSVKVRPVEVPRPPQHDDRQRSFFALQLPADRASGAAAVRLGVLARPEVVSAQQLGVGWQLRSLEYPRLPQLAQLMVVLPTALRARLDDEDVLVAFYAVRKFDRDARMDELGGVVRIIEGESLVTQASVLGLDTGEIRHVEDVDEMRNLQTRLAGQLLEALNGVIEVDVPMGDVERIWEEFGARRPAEFADQTLRRELWGEQYRAVASGVVSLQNHRAWLIAGEGGSGKTTLMIAAAWLSGERRVVVVCPATVLREWEDEIAALLPEARVITVRRPSDLRAVPEPETGHQQFVLIPDSAFSQQRRRRAGVIKHVLRDVDRKQTWLLRPTCSDCGRVISERADAAEHWLGGKASGALQCADVTCRSALWQQVTVGKANEEVIACSQCGWHQLDRDGRPLALSAARNRQCAACDADLGVPGAVTDVRVDRRTWPLPTAWKRYGFWSGLVVLDEMHRFKGADTTRGTEAGQMIGLGDRTVLATATVTNGTASSLYNILWRIVPRMLARFPDVSSFVSAFGMREATYNVQVNENRDELRRTAWKQSELPGLHPMLLPELLPWSSFLTRAEVIGEDIEWDEFLELVALPDDEGIQPVGPNHHPRRFESFMDEVFGRARRSAVTNAARRGGGEAVGAVWNLAERRLRGENPDFPLDWTEEEVAALVPQGSPRARYEKLREIVHDSQHARLRGGAAGVVPDSWTSRGEALRFYPDTWNFRGEVVTGRGYLPIAILPPTAPIVSGKEQRLVDIVLQERAGGRRCLVYVDGTGVRDVAGRLASVLADAGLSAEVVRPARQSAARRKDWVVERVHQGVDVLVSHPGSVGIGMNLQQFPTVIVYQVNPSSYTMRQSVMRSLRVDQTMAVRHIYLLAGNTVQESELLLDASRGLSAAPAEARASHARRFTTLLGESSVTAQMTGIELENMLRGENVDAVRRRQVLEEIDQLHAVAQQHSYVAPPRVEGRSVAVAAVLEGFMPELQRSAPGMQLSFFQFGD